MTGIQLVVLFAERQFVVPQPGTYLNDCISKVLGLISESLHKNLVTLHTGNGMFNYDSHLRLLLVGLFLRVGQLRIRPGFGLSGLLVRQVQLLGFVILREAYVS